ncbi:MAG: hypothetical protein V1797_01010 [Pseudomonadota bacterium]
MMQNSTAGDVIRLKASGIREIGRNTQGATLKDLNQGERIASVARLAEAKAEGEGDDLQGDLPLGEAGEASENGENGEVSESTEDAGDAGEGEDG